MAVKTEMAAIHPRKAIIKGLGPSSITASKSIERPMLAIAILNIKVIKGSIFALKAFRSGMILKRIAVRMNVNINHGV